MYNALRLAALSIGLSFLSSLAAADETFRPESG
ncbi:MAG: hypothetical protein RLZZ326_2918, partial [Planctomycetota bacterium]